VRCCVCVVCGVHGMSGVWYNFCVEKFSKLTPFTLTFLETKEFTVYLAFFGRFFWFHNGRCFWLFSKRTARGILFEVCSGPIRSGLISVSGNSPCVRAVFRLKITLRKIQYVFLPVGNDVSELKHEKQVVYIPPSTFSFFLF
jgi:hypothetical protein